MKNFHWPAMAGWLTTLAGAGFVVAQSGSVSPKTAAIIVAAGSIIQAFTKPVPKADAQTALSGYVAGSGRDGSA